MDAVTYRCNMDLVIMMGIDFVAVSCLLQFVVYMTSRKLCDLYSVNSCLINLYFIVYLKYF